MKTTIICCNCGKEFRIPEKDKKENNLCPNCFRDVLLECENVKTVKQCDEIEKKVAKLCDIGALPESWKMLAEDHTKPVRLRDQKEKLKPDAHVKICKFFGDAEDKIKFEIVKNLAEGWELKSYNVISIISGKIDGLGGGCGTTICHELLFLKK